VSSALANLPVAADYAALVPAFIIAIAPLAILFVDLFFRRGGTPRRAAAACPGALLASRARLIGVDTLHALVLGAHALAARPGRGSGRTGRLAERRAGALPAVRPPLREQ